MPLICHLTSLKGLLLHGNNFGPYSSIAITNELKNLPKLWDISFRNNNIGNEGCKAIIDILPNRKGN